MATNRSSARTAAWLGIAIKFFKSAKVIKAALAGMALSGWTVMYSFEFALVLIGTLVFHEYGHLRAMKRFGIKTRGMYLIPFFGGIAVGEKAQTHWQDVYISMMGPVFGLFMSAAFYLTYLVTENHFAGLVASISALINVFNLLPIHPLDGGRVVKALVFSGSRYWGFVLMLAISAAGFALAWHLGLVFLCFFVVIGALDLVFGWQEFATDTKPKLDRYGILFSLAWYIGTTAIFLALIVSIAASGLPGSELAVRVLES
jgi:putative peptide zinc metalloprotease protein